MNAIKAYRKKHRLTLGKFGALIGVQKAAVWKYENGLQRPSSETAIAIARATEGEIPIAELLPELAEAVRTDLERGSSDHAA